MELLKRIGIVFIAMLIGASVMLGVEYLSAQLFPIPSNIDFENYDALKAWISTLPVGAFLMILLGDALGCLTSGFVAALIAKENKIKTALITGTLFFIGGILNMISIPHPIWFIIVSIFVYHPFALMGALLAKRITKK